MKSLSYNLLKTLGSCFTGLDLYLQLLAVMVTYVISASVLDWKYFLLFQGTDAYTFLFPAVLIGLFFPIIFPLLLIIIGKVKKNRIVSNAGYATGQAGVLGWAISSFYKVFTGRPPPPETFGIGDVHAPLVDISKVFKFGFFRGGIFNGWPSSHTTVSVALSTTLIVLFPKNRYIQAFAVLYALYIGIGVSVSIHWFSDFVAGLIIGIVIGLAVGKSFRERIATMESLSS
jgi:membrane-associated phospholipid phosphatase